MDLLQEQGPDGSRQDGANGMYRKAEMGEGTDAESEDAAG